MAAGNCKAQLDDLQPERLDARLVAGRPDGPVDLAVAAVSPSSCALTCKANASPTPLRLRALLTHEGERAGGWTRARSSPLAGVPP